MPATTTTAAPPPAVDAPAYLPRSVAHCGDGAAIGQCPVTHRIVVVPLCCKSWACSYCATKLAHSWAHRIAEAEPQRLITITVNPHWHPSPLAAYMALKKCWTGFVKSWRLGRGLGHNGADRPHTLEYAAIWELQPGTGYPHLHVLQRGDYVPQAYLTEWITHARVGKICDIRAVKHAHAAARYVVKYTGKDAPNTKQLLRHRRLIMMSRHFLKPSPPRPTDEDLSTWTWFRVGSQAASVALYLRLHWRCESVPGSWPGLLIMMPLDPEFRAIDYADVLDGLSQEPPPGPRR